MRRGSCRREDSRRSARRNTPARRRVPRSRRSERSRRPGRARARCPGLAADPGGGAASVIAAHSRTARRPRRPPRRRGYPLANSQGARSMADGTVIIIGGAEDKVRDRVILSRFVDACGRPDATIAVISTASSLGLEAGERYRAGLRRARRRRRSGPSTRSPGPGQRRGRGARRCATRRHLPDRRQPAAAVLDDRRDAPRRRDPRPVPARARWSPGTSAGRVGDVAAT